MLMPRPLTSVSATAAAAAADWLPDSSLGSPPRVSQEGEEEGTACHSLDPRDDLRESTGCVIRRRECEELQAYIFICDSDVETESEGSWRIRERQL